jgi:hypothetical protein
MLGWLVVLSLSQSPPPARVTLRHVPGRGATSCPDQRWLEGNVTARLGYSPFTAGAPLTADTRFECGDGGCRADLELTDPPAQTRRRTLTSADCRELAESLALTLALAIDPQHLTRAPPPPAPVPALPPAPQPSAPPAAAPSAAKPAAPPVVPIFIDATIGLVGTWGLSPFVNGGARLAVGLRRGWFGLSIEGRADLPQAVSVEGGSVSNLLLLGSVAPCFHRFGLAFCVVGSAGAIQVSGQLSAGSRASSIVAAVGGRLSWEHLFLPWVGVVVHAGVQGVVTRVTVKANERAVWVTAPIALDGGAGIVLRF